MEKNSNPIVDKIMELWKQLDEEGRKHFFSRISRPYIPFEGESKSKEKKSKIQFTDPPY